MYAVIRTGGKQYRVAPGDTLKIERTAHENGLVEFSDVLAFSGEEGKFADDLGGAKVTAQVLGEGRGDKILVFKLKRKKQYKKMQGHRQNFVEVKINEILVFHFKRKKQYKKLQGHRQNFTEVRIKAIVADGVTYDADKK